MFLHSLRAYCMAPGRPGSISNYLGGLGRSTGVSGRLACGFRTILPFADAAVFLQLGVTTGEQLVSM